MDRDRRLHEYCLEHNISFIEVKYDLQEEEIENIITEELEIK